MDNKTKSLGILKTIPQPTNKHPRMTGTLKLHRHTLRILVKQFQEGHANVLVFNLATWVNQGVDAKFLTLELSPRYVATRHAIGEDRDALTELFDEDSDKSDDDDDEHWHND
jgi:hypothetical protein